MNALLSEFVSYFIKFILLLAAAGVGLKVGISVKKYKNRNE